MAKFGKKFSEAPWCPHDTGTAKQKACKHLFFFFFS